jgi:glutaredoxin
MTDARAAAATAPDDAVRVYWMTGCSSCLRTKEFLARHRVPFVSRDVLADPGAYEELARFGLRQVPIVTRGGAWANGQVLRDVAALAGIAWGAPGALPVPELRRRLEAILAGALRLAAQVPEARLEESPPGRPRPHADLIFHIFSLAGAFLEHEAGIPLVFDAYFRVPGPGARGRAALLGTGADVARRIAAYFDGPGRARDWTAAAEVYYGRQTVHEFLERTTWHAGQHTRQLAWILDGMGIAPDRPPGPEVYAGLPMPERVWDGEGP